MPQQSDDTQHKSIPLTLYARGHPNIKATHNKTFELTSDTFVTSSGTCIIGVDCHYDEDALLALRGAVRIHLSCAGVKDQLTAFINPTLRRGEPLIFRRHDKAQPRTTCIASTKSAAMLDRALINTLRTPDAELEVILEPISNIVAAQSVLYVIGLPIGNSADLSLRALDTLHSVDLIVAEDTRTTRAFLSEYGIKKTLLSLHDNNERQRTPQILQKMATGARIALVSEAGMPLISDPGYYLVQNAIEQGYLVTPVPGPDAVTSALSVAGLASNDFRFVGFLPRKSGPCRKRLAELSTAEYTIVFFEAPHRIVDTLHLLAQEFGQRKIAICRNLTKPGEEILRGDAETLATDFDALDQVRGEFTVVVEGATANKEADLSDEITRMLTSLAQAGVGTKTIAAAITQATGLPRREAFNRVLQIKDQTDIKIQY